MSPVRIAVLVVALAFLAGARSVAPITPSPPTVTTIPDSYVLAPEENDALDLDPDGSGIDVFGNEVDEAIGDYRIDVRGDLYERHSPETEVPRLRPPIG